MFLTWHHMLCTIFQFRYFSITLHILLLAFFSDLLRYGVFVEFRFAQAKPTGRKTLWRQLKVKALLRHNFNARGVATHTHTHKYTQVEALCKRSQVCALGLLFDSLTFESTSDCIVLNSLSSTFCEPYAPLNKIYKK